MIQLWDELDAARSVSELYQNSAQPAAVVNSETLLVWSNDRARELYPFLRVPDGIQTILSLEEIQDVEKSISQGKSCRVLMGGAPLLGSAIFFSPVCEGFALALFEQPAAPFSINQLSADATLATYSGQVRGPLNNIFNTLNYLANNPTVLKSESLMEPLHNISQNSYLMMRHCVNLTQFFRYICAANPLQCNLVNLSVNLQQLGLTTRIMMNDVGMLLELNIPEDPVYCNCDWPKVEAALLNLLSNACRFGSSGNVISLSLERRRDTAIVTVSDHGRGIAPEVLPHVFHPFYSNDQGFPFAGGGLGLTVAKLCTQAHGGAITLQSTPGVGTTVAFTLPVEQGVTNIPLYARDAANIACDLFCPMYVILSDACQTPWPPAALTNPSGAL